MLEDMHMIGYVAATNSIAELVMGLDFSDVCDFFSGVTGTQRPRLQCCQRMHSRGEAMFMLTSPWYVWQLGKVL